VLGCEPLAVTACQEGDMKRRRHRCRAILDRCFPLEADSRLHHTFTHSFCDTVSWAPFFRMLPSVAIIARADYPLLAVVFRRLAASCRAMVGVLVGPLTRRGLLTRRLRALAAPQSSPFLQFSWSPFMGQ
jgi:hypothetical protein